MRRGIVAAVVLAAAGCGGGGGGGGVGPTGTTSGGTTLTATGGVAFTASEAAALSGSGSCQAFGTTYGVAYAAVLASDQSGICGYLQRGQNKASARSIQVLVVSADPLHPTAAIGTQAYPIVAAQGTETQFALVDVSQNDAACTPTDVGATGGTVTITAIGNGRVAGTVDATLPGGGRVSGAFDAATCQVSFPNDVCAGQVGPQNPTCAP